MFGFDFLLEEVDIDKILIMAAICISYFSKYLHPRRRVHKDIVQLLR